MHTIASAIIAITISVLSQISLGNCFYGVRVKLKVPHLGLKSVMMNQLEVWGLRGKRLEKLIMIGLGTQYQSLFEYFLSFLQFIVFRVGVSNEFHHFAIFCKVNDQLGFSLIAQLLKSVLVKVWSYWQNLPETTYLKLPIQCINLSLNILPSIGLFNWLFEFIEHSTLLSTLFQEQKGVIQVALQLSQLFIVHGQYQFLLYLQ